MNNINGIYKKIHMMRNNIEQIILNKNFNSEWVGGKVPGELIDTNDGYRIRFDGQSRSFTPLKI
jgi:hypothetical protein